MKITQGAAVGLAVLLAIVVVGFSVGGVVLLSTAGDVTTAAHQAEQARDDAQAASGGLKASARRLRAYQARSCRRGKRINRANAAGWTAHSRYILQVTRAASVKEDVKRAARAASSTYQRTSSLLRGFTRITCPTPPK